MALITVYEKDMHPGDVSREELDNYIVFWGLPLDYQAWSVGRDMTEMVAEMTWPEFYVLEVTKGRVSVFSLQDMGRLEEKDIPHLIGPFTNQDDAQACADAYNAIELWTDGKTD